MLGIKWQQSSKSLSLLENTLSMLMQCTSWGLKCSAIKTWLERNSLDSVWKILVVKLWPVFRWFIALGNTKNPEFLVCWKWIWWYPSSLLQNLGQNCCGVHESFRRKRLPRSLQISLNCMREGKTNTGILLNCSLTRGILNESNLIMNNGSFTFWMFGWVYK